jgi:hypothetical protein
MIVIVIVQGETAIITDEAGRRLDEVSASRVLRRFPPSEHAPRMVGFFEATYEHGDLQLGDRIRRAPE